MPIYNYPAPRSPEYKKPASVEDCLPQARLLVRKVPPSEKPKVRVAPRLFVKDGLGEMEELLGKAEVGRLALCDGELPYVIPLNFVYYDKMIIFHCGWEGKKLDIIIKNPFCCFEVDEFKGKVAKTRPRGKQGPERYNKSVAKGTPPHPPVAHDVSRNIVMVHFHNIRVTTAID